MNRLLAVPKVAGVFLVAFYVSTIARAAIHCYGGW